MSVSAIFSLAAMAFIFSRRFKIYPKFVVGVGWSVGLLAQVMTDQAGGFGIFVHITVD